MANTLGELTSTGCFKNGNRMGNARYCHNCQAQNGNEVIWTFEVLDENNNVIGHVDAALKCSSRQGQLDEAGQKAAIIEIAESLLPD